MSLKIKEKIYIGIVTLFVMSIWLYRWYRFSTEAKEDFYPVYMSFFVVIYWVLFVITEFMRERGVFSQYQFFLPSLIKFGGAISITFIFLLLTKHADCFSIISLIVVSVLIWIGTLIRSSLVP